MGGGCGDGPSFFWLLRNATEFRGLPRLCGKYVADVAWISLQNK